MYRRLLERADVDAKSSADRTVGEVGGVSCTLARISIRAPAAALLLEDSIARGVRNVLVVGPAGSLQRHLPIGSTVIVTGAEREDGASHHYLPSGEVGSADPDLTAALDQMFVARRSARRYGERGVHYFWHYRRGLRRDAYLFAVVDEGLGACFVGSFYEPPPSLRSS